MADLVHPDYDTIRRRSGARWAGAVIDPASDAAAVQQFLAEGWDVDLSTTHVIGDAHLAPDNSVVTVWGCYSPVGDPYPRLFAAAVFPDGHVEDWTRMECCNGTPTGCGHTPRARWLR